METLLQVQDLTKTFYPAGRPPQTAVDHVSFSLAAGETLGLVGASGCGKSTLARLITRLTESTCGTVQLCGQDITAARGRRLRQACRQMQMVFQSPRGSFDPRRTVGSSVGESLTNFGVPKAARRARVAALLTQCGLPAAYADRYPHELSGGECQRAAIARALAIQPRLLICDEATSSLDTTVQQQIMVLLETLKQTHRLSLLFISHDLALVQSFCDRVLVMHEGRIVEESTPDALIAAPRSVYTRRLVEAAL